jgi:hypothetical protein
MASRQHPTTFFTGLARPQQGEGAQQDYSYNQWRHAQMRQMEGNYAAACERAAQKGAPQRGQAG